jgi:hypothetical protein
MAGWGSTNIILTTKTSYLVTLASSRLIFNITSPTESSVSSNDCWIFFFVNHSRSILFARNTVSKMFMG